MSHGPVEFRILGPLEVARGGTVLRLGGPKQRGVLALLLLNANRVVPVERFVDEVWGDEPPETVKRVVQVYVAEVRKLIADDPSVALVTRAPGYALELGSGRLDLHRFENLVANADRDLTEGRPKPAAAGFREALALWRGPALADLAHEPFAAAEIARLEELRLVVLEKRIEADLDLGRQIDAVPELEALVADHPLRERLRGQLMLALYRSGRQADALARYREAHRVLADELGIDPSPQLQRLERAILNQEPSLDLERPVRAALPTGTVSLLLTDIEASTKLLHDLGDRYPEVLSEQRRLLREAVSARGGVEVDAQGDAHFFVFERVEDAAAAAAACQRALVKCSWPDGAAVRVRMGIHTGAPTPVEWGYVGGDVHRAARVCSAAHGGQILLSAAASGGLRQAGALAADLTLHELGELRFKDIPGPETLAQLDIQGLPTDFPPPRSADTAPHVPTATPDRSILLAPEQPAGLDALLAIAEPLGRSQHAPHELILACLVSKEEQLAGAARHANDAADALRERDVAGRSVAFTSSDLAEDAVRLARTQDVDLILAGCPTSTLETGTFDPTLITLLSRAPCDVALVSSRPARAPEGPVLVPFSGADNDWSAIELAAWMARAGGTGLVLAGAAARPDEKRRDASRLLADASLIVQRYVGVTAEPLLIGAGSGDLIAASAKARAVVLGLTDRWRTEGLGASRLAVARNAAAPTLILKRGLRPSGLAPSGSLTRYTWSLGM